MTLDFGDGTTIEGYVSYSEITHRFAKPGTHILTAHTTIDGKLVMQKQKVLVASRTPR
jgi:hypothetical protein